MPPKPSSFAWKLLVNTELTGVPTATFMISQTAATDANSVQLANVSHFSGPNTTAIVVGVFMTTENGNPDGGTTLGTFTMRLVGENRFLDKDGKDDEFANGKKTLTTGTPPVAHNALEPFEVDNMQHGDVVFAEITAAVAGDGAGAWFRLYIMEAPTG